jgi:hypothetical protein
VLYLAKSRKLRSMRFVVVIGFVMACGGSGTQDAGMDGSGSDGTVSDAALDVPIDMAMGTLSPDPPMPVGMACAGLLGFPNPPKFVSEGKPRMADLDGNGVVDLVTIGTSIAITRGRGDGTFALSSTLAPPGVVRDFALADMSGDGRPDLVVGATVNGFDDALFISANDGAGNFGAFSRVENGDTVTDVLSVADVDGDGRLDIVMLDASTKVTVVRRTVTGGYGSPEVYTTPGWDLAVGDLSGDGRPEIVVAASLLVFVMMNNGSGAFAEPVTYPTTDSHQVAVGDMNEDGDGDVILITRNATHVQVGIRLGNGTGTLGAEASFPMFPTENTTAIRSITVGDLNGDDHLDVATSYGSFGITYALGTGTGQIGSARQLLHFNGDNYLAFADTNNDARTDILVASFRGATTFVNKGADLFASRQALPFVGAARFTHVDADTHLDFVTHSNVSSVFKVGTALGNGAGAFVTTDSDARATGDFVVGDLDNDAKLDAVVAGRLRDPVTPGLVHPGFETFLSTTGGLVSSDARMGTEIVVLSVELVDMDGNGFRDVVIASHGPFPSNVSDVTYYPGLGAGRFGAGVTAWSGNNMTSAAVGDLDGDGRPDVVVHFYAGVAYEAVVRNLGNGNFASPMVSDGEFPTSRFFIVDVNHDGKRDIAGLLAPDLIVRLGNGDGTVGAPIRSIGRSGGWIDAQVADFNGDGHVDIAGTGATSLLLWLGNADGTFREEASYDSGGGGSISVGDYDQDGRLDILLGHSLLRGRCL